MFECCLSTLTQPTIVLLLVYCSVRRSKSAQKSAVQMCQVAAVVMETTQLVLSPFFIVVNGELNKVSYAKIISERCELVKLCDYYCSSPVVLKHTVVPDIILQGHSRSSARYPPSDRLDFLQESV